jgi:hypothetical protein
VRKAVKNARKLKHIRDYLRDNYSNATEENLNDLFEFYIDVENTRER